MLELFTSRRSYLLYSRLGYRFQNLCGGTHDANRDFKVAQKQQIADYKEQVAAATTQYNQQQEMLDKAKALLDRQDALAAKQAAANERFNKVLDVWERQQTQYQKYLDSLSQK